MTGRVLAYIGIGSNAGNPYRYTKTALDQLAAIRHTELVEHSSLYWSDPVSPWPQDRFLNSVALVSTALSPDTLLLETQRIEQVCGRKRTIRWGPRTMDLDILFYDTMIFQTDNLVIPHPLVHHRLFTIIPLLEISPDYRHPILNDYLSKHVCRLRTEQHISLGYTRVPGRWNRFLAMQSYETERC